MKCQIIVSHSAHECFFDELSKADIAKVVVAGCVPSNSTRTWTRFYRSDDDVTETEVAEVQRLAQRAVSDLKEMVCNAKHDVVYVSRLEIVKECPSEGATKRHYGLIIEYSVPPPKAK